MCIHKNNNLESIQNLELGPVYNKMRMLKEWLLKNKLKVLILISLVIFSRSLVNFFSSDDWFHLRVVQIDNFLEFLDFFSFKESPQSISFYRPLSTQFFFFIFYKLFGLNSIIYFLFGLVLFGLIIYFLYELLILIKIEEKTALISTLFYALSASNFARLNFISAFQELFLGLFILISCHLYLKNNNYFKVFFVFALLSKETAIIFGGIVILLDWLLGRNVQKNIKKYLSIILISTVYLFLRLKVFKSIVGESYIWDFSLRKAANTTMWYGLRSLGIPEFLVDYVGSGFKIIPKFFIDFPVWSKIFLIEIMSLFLVIGLSILLKIKIIKQNFKKIIFGLFFFGLTLLPVLFLPWHKFSHALTLPLIGVSLILGLIYKSNSKILRILILVVYLVLNLSTIYNLNQRHYSVNRGRISWNVYQFFKQNYPNYPEGICLEFINDTTPEAKQWGSSKQVAYALSNLDFFKVFYKNNQIKIYYEDFNETCLEPKIELSSKKFLENW